jgi:hypothetical protein
LAHADAVAAYIQLALGQGLRQQFASIFSVFTRTFLTSKTSAVA